MCENKGKLVNCHLTPTNNSFMLTMGKISVTDKMRIQTLRELGLGYKAITKKYELVYTINSGTCSLLRTSANALTSEVQLFSYSGAQRKHGSGQWTTTERKNG